MITSFDMLIEERFIAYEANKGGKVTGLLHGTSTAMSCVCCHQDAFFRILADGIACFAEESDIDYTLIDASRSSKAFIRNVKSPPKDIKGMLLVPWEIPGYKEAVEDSISNGMKMVFVDRVIPGIDASSVTSDHYGGAFAVASHLLKTHRSPVYYIGYTNQPSSGREWLRGWSDAMGFYGYDDLEKYIFGLNISAESVALSFDSGLDADIEAAIRLFKKRKIDEPFCVLAGNSYVARGTYIVADKLGLEIGRDVFVAAMGDPPFAENFDVPLTCARLFPERVGYEAAKLLNELFSGSIDSPIEIRIPYRLVVRQSSGG